MKYLSIILFILFSSCKDQANSQSTNSDNLLNYENLINSDYWNDGKAEIATYELVQNRYNALHPGNVIMIFVTEDFLTDKQVKNESYTSTNSTKVLKNIQIKNFTTGVYEYNLHTSTFTPLDRNKLNTLKVTNSMQEWCGTTFRQLNNKDSKYELQVRSYFEGEGDVEFKLAEVVLEDEFMNLIRISPSLLPIGEFEIISSLNFLSLRHKEPKVEKAKATTKKYTGNEFTGKNLNEFSYSIESQYRKVKIVFENESPHQIVGYKESYPSAFDGEVRTTVAKLKEIKRLKYWGLNNPEDKNIRKELGL